MRHQSLHSEAYMAYCQRHALPEHRKPDFDGTEPYSGNAYTDIYHGTMKDSPIQVKVWRGVSMNHEKREELMWHLGRELDDWKRASGHRNINHFHGLNYIPSWMRLPELVTPLYSNGNILQYLKRNPNVNLLSLLHNVADALTYMHSLDPPVVHGGVQGANILIADNGEAHLSDLCISFLPHSQDVDLGVGDGHEPVRWMAPEVIDPPTEDLKSTWNATTRESDVYSFGMTMLELFSGSNPYVEMKRYASVLFAALDGIRPPRPDVESLTDDIWALIQCCWAHNPRDRPNMALVRSSIHTLWLKSSFPFQSCSSLNLLK